VKARTVTVSEVMTRDVVSLTPETPLKDAAVVIAERGVSGVPVSDQEGRVVGVLSETDLLVKQGGLPHRVGGLVHWLVETASAPDAAKLRARTVGEAMTAPAITTEPDRPVTEAARRMVERQVNRLPVVEDGRLVGIVTRADLVRLFTRSDEELTRVIRQDVIDRMSWIPSRHIQVDVEHGEAVLRGQVESEFDANLLLERVSLVPGLVTARSELTWSLDAKGRPLRKKAAR
jgi:CBS domain-containing protein